MMKMAGWLGMGLALMVLVISVVRSSEESAYAYVIPDEDRSEGKVSGDAVGRWDLGANDLPGNPVYVGKMIVDKASVWLTIGSEKKVVLYIEYANERMDAAEELMSLGRIELAMKTAAKGAGYLKLASEELAKVEDKELINMWADLETATYVHEDLLKKFETAAGGGEDLVLDKLCDEVLLVREKAESEMAR